MKIAFLFGDWSIGQRKLDFNCLFSSPRGLTGSDLGVCMTSAEMVKLGHDVSLFTVHEDNKPDDWEGVKLYHMRDAPGVINSNQFDAIVSWSEPDILRGLIGPLGKPPIRVVCQMLNDFTYCQPGFDEAVDIWTAPCQMLIDHLMTKPNAPSKDKFHVLPLGTDPSWFSDQRVKNRVVFTSSADRGLHNLLEIWPEVRKSVPDANLRIFYNFNYSSTENMEPNSNNLPIFLEMGHRSRYMKEVIKRLKPFGVDHIGSVSRDRMHKELSEASVFAYPVDTLAFTEGFSVSCLEGLASYTAAVFTDCDCLGSIYKDSGGIMIKSPIRNNLKQFTEEIIKVLIDQEYANNIIKKSMEFAKEYTWQKSSQKLESIILND